MSVTAQHEQYKNSLPKWKLVRDCDEGSKKIKEGGEAYLPMPNKEDQSPQNKNRYIAYVVRANFVNFTAHTKEGMTGMVFRKRTQVELTQEVDYLKTNMNGDGLTADQMIKDVSCDILLTGRYGLLTDYPQAEKGLTEAEVRDLELRATIKQYPAESVINWRTKTIGGINKLSMVVLLEPTECIAEDGFEITVKDYHRVLLLKEIEEKLTYVQNVYDDEDKLIVWQIGVDENQEPVYTGDIIPTKSDGTTWNEIPFTFIGSDNNDATVDKAPLYDIAEVNVAHYRNSADYEESSFMVGQPTPWVSGLTQGWVDDNYKDGIALGSRSGLMLPVDGAAGLMQAEANQMPLKGMEIKEQQMVMIGTRIIQDSSGVETAEAAKIRFAGQNSKLGSIIINVEAAFVQCFKWAGEFMGGTKEPEVDINKDLYDKTIDPQLVMAQIQLHDRGIIAKSDVQDNMRDVGIVGENRTNEQIDDEAENGNPIV